MIEWYTEKKYEECTDDIGVCDDGYRRLAVLSGYFGETLPGARLDMHQRFPARSSMERAIHVITTPVRISMQRLERQTSPIAELNFR